VDGQFTKTLQHRRANFNRIRVDAGCIESTDAGAYDHCAHRGNKSGSLGESGQGSTNEEPTLGTARSQHETDSVVRTHSRRTTNVSSLNQSPP
jgi:hypothetical protein